MEPRRGEVRRRATRQSGRTLKRYLHHVDARSQRRMRTVLLQVEPEFELAVRRGYTDAGEAVAKLIPRMFRLNSEFVSAQNRLMQDIGLSSALWRVLEVVSQARRPLHVASFARVMHVSRQSVQKIVNELKADGYVRLADNPRNRQAKLVLLTEKGLKTYRAATMRQVPWTNRVSDGLDANDIAVLGATVETLIERLVREGRRTLRDPGRSREQPTRRILTADLGTLPEGTLRATGRGKKPATVARR